MRRDLLIGAGPGEWRAAWLEDGVAVELHVERGDSAPAGSVHLGRVLRRVAGLDAALVEIGDPRPGFLPLRGPLDEGARVVVQVRREMQRGKGALLSNRLGDADVAWFTETAARAEPPARLAPALGFAAALAMRLPNRPDRVVTDDPAIVPELRGVFAEAPVEHRPAADWPIDLDALFDAALAPDIALPGGGSVHIDESRAAVLIDVDTGSPEVGSAERTAAAANLAAAAVIARAIRLQQLAGGIIIDFAALEGRGPRDRVRQALATELADDPAGPQVLGWTRLGHLEIVRPRRSRPLSEAMLDAPGARKSPVALAFEALRVLYREARARPAANWRLVVAPAVEAALRGPAAAGLRALEGRLGRTIAVVAAPGHDVPPFDIAAR